MASFKNVSKSQENRLIKKKIERHLKLVEFESKINTVIDLKNIYITPACTSTKCIQLEASTSSSNTSEVLGEFNIDDCVQLSPNIVETAGDIELIDVDEDTNDSFQSSLNISTASSEVGDSVEASAFLVNWSIENKITHTALTQLLKYLKANPKLDDLPSDARTLLQTPRRAVVTCMGNGQFIYIGLKLSLEKCLNKKEVQNLELSFNIDGLPIHKSTKLSFWPILCKIVTCPWFPVFAVAIYCGKTKPPLHNFLSEFILELQDYLINGFHYNNKKLSISIHSFVCDTPARSYIKCVKSFNGYSGCDNCMCKGLHYKKRMLFLSQNDNLRTDRNFRLKIDKMHHSSSDSPLLKLLNIDMIINFPVDYMHNVCLGVVRKLLFIWRDQGFRYNIKSNINIIDKRISSINNLWPVDFNRKLRSLSELEHWKATELRSFLIYYGPFLLRNILPKDFYENFLLLQCGISILLNEKLNNDYNDYASHLLNLFVKNAKKLYGKTFLIYNVHSVIHLVDIAKSFKSLNNVSCFPFENFLHSLKLKLRKGHMPLAQIYERLHEEANASDKNEYCNFSNDIICLNECEIPTHFTFNSRNLRFYKKVQIKSYIISIAKDADSYIRHMNTVDTIKIHFISKNIKTNIITLYGVKFSSLGNFENYPTTNNILSTYIIDKDESNLRLEKFAISDIWSKAIVMSYDNVSISKPFYHCDFK